MADDHARSASGAEPDSRSKADGPEESPGGGPKRVVSETSVDDILSSIGSESGGTDGDRNEGTQSNVSGEERDDGGDDDGDDNRGDDDRGDDGDRVGGDGSEDGEDELDEGTSVEESNDLDRSDDDELSVERRAEDLSERIERGSVTGADVRAAEAGEGRDPTPSVDEIDLSVDDLETTTASTGGTGPSTGGRGGGTVDRGAAGTADEADDGATSDEESNEPEPDGLVGRLKRFLSR